MRGNKSGDWRLQIQNKSDRFDGTEDTRKTQLGLGLDSTNLRKKKKPSEKGGLVQRRFVCRIVSKGYLSKVRSLCPTGL